VDGLRCRVSPVNVCTVGFIVQRFVPSLEAVAVDALMQAQRCGGRPVRYARSTSATAVICEIGTFSSAR
jgi:hypothetical protein